MKKSQPRGKSKSRAKVEAQRKGKRPSILVRVFEFLSGAAMAMIDPTAKYLPRLYLDSIMEKHRQGEAHFCGAWGGKKGLRRHVANRRAGR